MALLQLEDSSIPKCECGSHVFSININRVNTTLTLMCAKCGCLYTVKIHEQIQVLEAAWEETLQALGNAVRLLNEREESDVEENHGIDEDEYEKAEQAKELQADRKLQDILDKPRPGEPGYKG